MGLPTTEAIRRQRNLERGGNPVLKARLAERDRLRKLRDQQRGVR